MIAMGPRPDIGTQNAQFWNELCGTNLARSLNIRDHSPESLRRYDEAYLRMYPYLENDLRLGQLGDRHVLEIGLGYGTVGQLLASMGCHYYGMDIAEGPVTLMRHRLTQLGQGHVPERVRQGSVLAIPYQDLFFDYVYSIGCLHHTGNLPRAISEVHRVLKPHGKALITLYNRYSFRRVMHGSLWCYDFNADGKVAPHTEYVSRSHVRRLFKEFGHVRVESRNCDGLVFLNGRLAIPREKLLNTVGRFAGLDLYIWATK